MTIDDVSEGCSDVRPQSWWLQKGCAGGICASAASTLGVISVPTEPAARWVGVLGSAATLGHLN